MVAHDFQTAMAEVAKTFVAAHVASRPLHTAQAGEAVGAVLAWAVPAAIDNVPVVYRGRVVGVLENVNSDEATPPPTEARADRAMRALEADMLLEARTPLGALVDLLLAPPHYRLVLDEGRIDAIVTPSDLVKLPMRVLAFAAVAHLEQSMLEAARRLFADDESALSHLDGDSQTQIVDLHRRLAARDLDPSLMDVASLRQKAKVLTDVGVFGDTATADSDFDDLVAALRNPLMHASAYVDDSIDALLSLDRRLRAVAERTAQAQAAAVDPQ